MRENKFIKILRLLVLLILIVFLGFTVYSLTKEMIESENYWLILVDLCCLGAFGVVIANVINIIKNWKTYWGL